MPDRQRLAAVLTAYSPDPSLAARFGPLLAICGWIIVVDNTPGGHAFGQLPEGFVLLQDGVNKGLGPALNVGVLEARRRGVEQVFLFDQDSTPSLELLRNLLEARATVLRAGDELVGVGPRFVDDSLVGEQPAQPAHGVAMQPMTCLPTSGMLLPVVPFCESGGFASDLFLDFVDFEWCWRVRARGWRFYRALQVPMFHRLGLAQKHLWGLHFHVPAPYRHYFQFRDTMRVTPRSYVPMYSRIRLLGVLPLKLIVYPFILDRGRERLAWMGRGIRDALRGVSGIGAAASRLGRG
jgi:rhamnosyltransferase